ncbi:MAG: nucleotidyltransferase domain-containing protein [Nitrospirota bacterium]
MLLKVKGIKFAFIYGSYAKGTQEKESDIDLMIIGEVDLDELNDEINTMEEQLNRELNYMVFDEAEYKKRKEEKDGFLLEVIRDKKIVLIGKEDDR